MRNVRLWQLRFPAIETQELRILFDHPGQDSISLTEVEILDAAGNKVPHMLPVVARNVGEGENVMAIYDNPAFSISRYHNDLKGALGDGDVRFADEDSLPAGTPTGSLMYLHRIINNRDVYFFSNSTEEPIETTVLLRTDKTHQFAPRRFVWWNPHDGTRTYVYVQGEFSEGTTAIPLKLGPVESRFLIGI